MSTDIDTHFYDVSFGSLNINFSTGFSDIHQAGFGVVDTHQQCAQHNDYSIKPIAGNTSHSSDLYLQSNQESKKVSAKHISAPSTSVNKKKKKSTSDSEAPIKTCAIKSDLQLFEALKSKTKTSKKRLFPCELEAQHHMASGRSGSASKLRRNRTTFTTYQLHELEQMYLQESSSPSKFNCRKFVFKKQEKQDEISLKELAPLRSGAAAMSSSSIGAAFSGWPWMPSSAAAAAAAEFASVAFSSANNYPNFTVPIFTSSDSNALDPAISRTDALAHPEGVPSGSLYLPHYLPTTNTSAVLMPQPYYPYYGSMHLMGSEEVEGVNGLMTEGIYSAGTSTDFGQLEVFEGTG